MKIKNLMMLFLVSCLGLNTLVSVRASDDEDYPFNIEDDSLNSDGEYYEYPAMDVDGKITMVKIPEVNPEDIEQEKAENASSYDVVISFGNEDEVIATYDSLQEAEAVANARRRMRRAGSARVVANTDYSNLKYGVVDFHTKPSNTNTLYTETLTGYSGYINGAYGGDAAFLGYCSTDKSKVKFRMAGVEGCVNASDVIVRDADDAYVGFYRVENGILCHYIHADVSSPYYSSVINVGPKQSYMSNNVVYYSYDGHYFYTSYEKMIDDYKNNTYAHSINPNQPYYNYFQYLSHRSKTTFTAQQLDAYTKTIIDFDSKMLNLGSAFITNQNKYGANALLMYGVAANESAWGTSSIAMNKNNIFGHNATDFNPSANANKYNSPAESVEHHAKNFISDGYLDPKDYSGRFFGGHLGDKASGMNVKYASDPFWGEKAAAVANVVSQKNGNKDFGTYKIGMVEKMTNLQVRKDANTSSTALYATKNISNFPVLIKATTTGQSIEGNNVWYRIQSDPTLNSNRSATTQGTYTYDFSKMYGYVSSQYVELVKYTNVSTNVPNDNTSKIIPGDVNGDGKLTPADYIKIKNHIMRVNILSGNPLKAADANGDGNITPADYIYVKNRIMEQKQ